MATKSVRPPMVTRATRNALAAAAAAQGASMTPPAVAPPPPPPSTPSPKKVPAALPKKTAKTPTSVTPSKAKSKRPSTKAKAKAKSNAKRKIEEDESDQEEGEEPKKPVGVDDGEDEEVEVEVVDDEEDKIETSDDSESDDDEDENNEDEDENEEDSKKGGEARKPVGSTKPLTSRQRAMLDKDGPARKGSKGTFPLALPDLPPKSGKRKAETEDELFRKAENAAKRKRQAQRQLEEEKNAVIDRLLNFTRRKADDADSESTSDDGLPSNEAQQSTIRCVWRSPTSTKNRRVPGDKHSKATSNPCTNFLCFPEVLGLPSELRQKPSSIDIIPSVQCAVCQKHPRRYDCSKTKLPLCSLSCYRNLHSLQR